MRVVLSLLISCLLSVAVHAQQKELRDTIAATMMKISVSEDDSVKMVCAGEIEEYLKQLAFGSYSLQSPVKYLGYKQDQKSGIELFAWNFPVKGELGYYNLLRFKDGRSYTMKFIPGDQNTMVSYLFYDFVPFQSGGKQYLVLLGVAPGKKTNKKVVQIAAFEENGQVNLNIPLLRKGNSRSPFLLFEYSKEGSMTLKPDKNGKRIIFDHLSPSDKRYEGYFMFYGPDGFYNALELKKGEWWFVENVKL